ncbi:uncharacterized protein LOC144124082 [Amblyomma americanum]
MAALAYADGIVLVASSLAELRTNLDVPVRHFPKQALKLNPTKTQYFGWHYDAYWLKWFDRRILELRLESAVVKPKAPVWPTAQLDDTLGTTNEAGEVHVGHGSYVPVAAWNLLLALGSESTFCKQLAVCLWGNKTLAQSNLTGSDQELNLWRTCFHPPFRCGPSSSSAAGTDSPRLGEEGSLPHGGKRTATGAPPRRLRGILRNRREALRDPASVVSGWSRTLSSPSAASTRGSVVPCRWTSGSRQRSECSKRALWSPSPANAREWLCLKNAARTGEPGRHYRRIQTFAADTSEVAPLSQPERYAEFKRSCPGLLSIVWVSACCLAAMSHRAAESPASSLQRLREGGQPLYLPTKARRREQHPPDTLILDACRGTRTGAW